MNVAKLSIVVDEDESGRSKPGAVLAYFYPDTSKEWDDPHGGFFDEVEQERLWRVAREGGRAVLLSEGTKWEHTVWCRLSVVTK